MKTEMRKNAENERRDKRAYEFSKRTVCAMTVLWFIGAVVGGFVVLWQLFTGAYAVQLDSLLNYIGMPMTGGIVGYMAKSALENLEKVKRYTDDRDIV